MSTGTALRYCGVLRIKITGRGAKIAGHRVVIAPTDVKNAIPYRTSTTLPSRTPEDFDAIARRALDFALVGGFPVHVYAEHANGAWVITRDPRA